MFKHESVDIAESTLVTNIGIDRSGFGAIKNNFQTDLQLISLEKCSI